MILDIVRHAETQHNTEGRLQGSSDILLSKQGIQQAVSLQKILLNNYDYIFCSPMKRTQQTLSLALGNQIEDCTNPIETPGYIMVNENLREMNLGVLEGKKELELENEYKQMLVRLKQDLSFNEHKGETPLQFFLRVNSFFNEICEMAKLPQISKILVITHNGVIQVLLQHILKITNAISPNNAELLRFEIESGEFQLIHPNLDRLIR
jgi:probable phosphoglycerate mutase